MRDIARRAEQTTEMEHDLELQRRRHDEKLTNEQKSAQSRREERQQESELQLNIQKSRDARKQTHLAILNELGVNLTEYLTQNRADQIIELRGRDGANSHFHSDAQKKESVNDEG